MKKILLGLLLLTAACKKDDDPQMGCQYGTNKATGTKEFIRCCTQAQHTAGNNTAAGGTAAFTNYSSVKWQLAENCDICQTLNYSTLP